MNFSSHAQIIESHGEARFAELLGVSRLSKVRFWVKRGAIPPQYWLEIAEKGLASLEELATASANRGKHGSRPS